MEIERKYLINKRLWESVKDPDRGTSIKQAYLSVDPCCTIRIRIKENQAFLTIKGESTGISREEFEYAIPMAEGTEILKMAKSAVILKHRYKLDFKGFTWEIDEFHGDNEGLILAEVELKNESEQPEWPEWVQSEVSGDPRFYNLNLALHPYKFWTP
jgi:adenylate cyclase